MLSISCNNRVKSETNQKHPQKIIRIKPFIGKHKWEGINCLPEKNYWEKFGKNNVT